MIARSNMFTQKRKCLLYRNTCYNVHISPNAVAEQYKMRVTTALIPLIIALMLVRYTSYFLSPFEADAQSSRSISMASFGSIQSSDNSSWLHTQGKKILNSANQEVVWNGLTSKTLFGYSYYGQDPLDVFVTPEDVQLIRNKGLNNIRIDIMLNVALHKQPSSVQTPTNLTYYPRFWQILDGIVDAGEQYGVWITINYGHSDGTWAPVGGFWGDGNGLPTWMYDGSWPYFNKIYANDVYGRDSAIRDFWNIDDPTAANVRIAYQTFWKDIAYRYKDRPGVVFSLFNEPQNQWVGAAPIWMDQAHGAAMFKTFTEQTIDLIQTIDSGRHIILVNDAYFWSWETNPKIDRSNIVISNHAYYVIDQSFVDLAWRYDQPFILGEFGGIEQGLQDRTGTIANIEFCNSLNVSWNYLNYDTTRGYPSAQTWTDLKNYLLPNLKYY